MRWQQIGGGGRSTYIAVLEPGDEAVGTLARLIGELGLSTAQVTAVGAFQSAVVGWFDREARDYRRIPVDQQCEILSLVGDVAQGPDGPVLHAHVVLGLPDGTTRGGTCWRATSGRRWRSCSPPRRWPSARPTGPRSVWP